MMPEAIAKLKTLTPQHQQEVLDFIEFLKTKEQRQASEATQSVEGDASKQIDTEAAKDHWQAEPFFGIWRDQEDMKDRHRLGETAASGAMERLECLRRS